MGTSMLAAIGYIAWTLVLIIVNEVYRTVLVLAGRHAPHTFRPDGADVSPFAQRLARAHANCYESFPIVAGPLLVALATGHAAATDPLALWVLGARVAQSTTHLISTSALAVQIRFAFFATQLAIAAWWVVQLLRRWAA